MSLTLKELLDWVPEIADLAKTTRDAAANHANSAEFLTELTKASDWEGHGGDAARAAMKTTAEHHGDMAKDLGQAAGGMEQTRHDAEVLANQIKGILNHAEERPAVEINTSTNAVIPPNTDYLDDEAAAKVAAKVADLQGKVAAALAQGEQVDASLAGAIATASGTVAPGMGATAPIDGGAGGYRQPQQVGGKPSVLGADGGAAASGVNLPTSASTGGQPPQVRDFPPPEANTTIGNVGDAIERSAGKMAEYTAVPKQSTGLGPTQGQLNRAAVRASESWETIGKFGKPLGAVGFGMEAVNGYNEGIQRVKDGASVGEAIVDVAPKTGGSMAGAFVGAATGAEYGAGTGAAIGTVVPGIGTAVGAAVGAGVGAVAGGIAGSTIGKSMGETVSRGWHAVFDH